MFYLKKSAEKINIKAIEKTLRKKFLNVEFSVFFLTTFIAIYIIVFSYFTIMKNYAFGTYAWDLGIFNQALWTTVHNGKFFYYTCELLIIPSGSFFGIHFSPILFVILPFYAILPSIETLLVMQSVILALGVLPLYKLAKHVLQYRLVGLVFSLAYLLYPALQGVNWFDFHIQSFLPLFFLSALYFLEKKNFKIYFLFTFLALMVEEHAAMIVFFIGVFYFLHNGKQIISNLRKSNIKTETFIVPTLTMVLSALWYILTLWIRNSFFPINPNFLNEFLASANWSVLGVKQPLMIPFYIFLNPTRAIAALEHDFLAKIGYILVLFAPLAFNSFRKLKYLIPILPWFLYALFSNNPSYYSIYIQYPTYIIAFIFIAAIYAFRAHARNMSTYRNAISLKKGFAFLLICSLAAFFIASPISPRTRIVAITEHERLVHEVLRFVPQNASIMTQSNIFPHVSSRINAYTIPVIHLIWHEKVQEFRNFTNSTLSDVDYILVDLWTDPVSTQLIFQLLQSNNQFSAYVVADSIVLFKRDFNDSAMILSAFTEKYNFQNLILYGGNRIEDPTSESKIILYFNGTIGSSPMFWYGPRALLPPGKYNITVRHKINVQNIMGNEVFSLEVCSNDGQKLIFAKSFFDYEYKSDPNWKDFTFNINLNQPLVSFEVRGVRASNQADIYLDYIDVTQISSNYSERVP